MSETTKIEWTATVGPDGTVHPGYTFNPWIGCQKVAAGCQNCYAEADFDKRRHFAQWGPNGTRVMTSAANWKKPLVWNRHAKKLGVRLKVFCASLADVFEDWKGVMVNPHCERPTMAAARLRLFFLIANTPNLDWLLLTKRPENIPAMWPHDQFDNVWLGTSISTQADADKNIPELIKCRHLASKLFVSAEPLLEGIDLARIPIGGAATDNELLNSLAGEEFYEDPGGHFDPVFRRCGSVDWVIIGGESGPHARPCHIAWIRSLAEQCRDANVPAFVKQMGANIEACDVIDAADYFPGKVRLSTADRPNARVHLQHIKGGDPSEWLEELRVRQWPQ